MSWPPSTGNPTGFTEEGITTVIWGTDGILAGFILKSIRATDAVEKIYIENGVGLRAVRIRLIHGREYELTMVAQTNFVVPAVGGTLTVIEPLTAVSITFSVDSRDAIATRKAEEEFVIKGVYDNLIAP